MPVVILIVIGFLVAGVTSGVATWIAFAVIVWAGMLMLFGGKAQRRRQRRAERHQRRAMAMQAMMGQQAPVPAPAPPAPAPLPPPPVPVVDLNQLPKPVQKQVDRIKRKADVLGRHPDRFPMGSKDLYVVQQTASDYLPATVRAFTEVPPWSVETPTGDGRTPLDILNNQLDMLETKLDEIAETVRKQRVDNLLANERFLEESFGRPRSEAAELTIPH